MRQAQGQVTLAVLLPVLITLLGVLIAQAVTLYNSRVTRLAPLRELTWRHEAELSKDLRTDRVAQYAKCLAPARSLSTSLEGLPPPPATDLMPASTGEVVKRLGLEFAALLNAFNESMSGAQL